MLGAVKNKQVKASHQKVNSLTHEPVQIEQHHEATEDRSSASVVIETPPEPSKVMPAENDKQWKSMSNKEQAHNG
jgi:hypothetical protein